MSNPLVLVETGGGEGFSDWLGTAATICSFLVAAWAFLRDARIRQFEVCLRLSEQIETLWAALSAEEDLPAYRAKLLGILNHYERSACYLNSLRALKGRPEAIVRSQIIETMSRNWNDAFFQEVWREAHSGPETYVELRKLLRRSPQFRGKEV